MKISIADISCTSVFMPNDYIIGMVMKVSDRGDTPATTTTTTTTIIYVRDNSGGTVPVAVSFIQQESQHQQGPPALERGVTIRCEDLQARPHGRDSNAAYRTELHSGRATVLTRRLFTAQQMLRNVEVQNDCDYLAQAANTGRTTHNILGIVIRVFPRSDDIVTKLGRITTKQSILLLLHHPSSPNANLPKPQPPQPPPNNNNNILVTFWGSQATELLTTVPVEGQTVMLLENVAISTYNGRLQATSTADTLLSVDPPIPAAAALLEAAAQGALRVHVRPDDIVDTYTVAMIARTLESMGKSRGGMADTSNSAGERPSVYGRLVGAVSYVGLGARPPTFLACPVCRRRVADTHCAGCGKAVFPVATLALRIRVMDSTGEVALTLFGAAAEQFLGVSADDIAGKEPTLEARWAMQARALWVRHSVAFRISAAGTISVLQCVPYK